MVVSERLDEKRRRTMGYSNRMMIGRGCDAVVDVSDAKKTVEARGWKMMDGKWGCQVEHRQEDGQSMIAM